MADHGPWLVETIPDEDDLFYRVPKGDFGGKEETLHSGVFRENKGSMSCDWEKYSSADLTRSRTGKPTSFGIVRLNAKKILEISGLTLEHDPDFLAKNQAHSSVLGLGPSKGISDEARAKLNGLRYELLERFNTWEIAPSDPVKEENVP